MKESAIRVSGAILAGGKSPRFGRDKPRMELAGERILEQLVGLGITTALSRLSSGIFVTACDMPLGSGPSPEWLVGHYDPQADAVIPHAGRLRPGIVIN